MKTSIEPFFGIPSMSEYLLISFLHGNITKYYLLGILPTREFFPNQATLRIQNFPNLSL